LQTALRVAEASAVRLVLTRSGWENVAAQTG